MEVKQLFVTLINIAYFGETPFIRLLNGEKMMSLAKAFEFNEPVEVQQQTSGSVRLRFQNGIDIIEEVGEFAIPRLDVEPRKLVMEFAGPSEHARTTYSKIANTLEKLVDAPSEALLDPIFHVEESIIVAQLDFPVEMLFVNPLRSAAEAAITKSSGENFTAHLRPRTVNFEVSYVPVDQSLSESRVGLTQKDLIIGPKAGLSSTDQIYESRAPLDTGSHIAFLEQLEASIKGIE